MTEVTETVSRTVAFKLPQDENVNVTIDTSAFPESSIAKLLTGAARNYVINRTNQAAMKFKKAQEAFKALNDPTADAPVAPDYAAIASSAKTDMLEGKMRTQTEGGAPKVTRDPVDQHVTKAVIGDLFKKMRKTDTSVKYPSVVKLVGTSGIAYLNAQITAKAGGDTAKEAELRKQMETRYLKPARALAGVNAKGEAIAATDDDLI